jgi:hypothetical protein
MTRGTGRRTLRPSIRRLAGLCADIASSSTIPGAAGTGAAELDPAIRLAPVTGGFSAKAVMPPRGGGVSRSEATGLKLDKVRDASIGAAP